MLICRKVETDHSGTGSEIRRKIVKVHDESCIQQIIGNGSQEHPEWCVDGFVMWPEPLPRTVPAKMSDEELLESFAQGGCHDFAIEIARRFQVRIDAIKADKAAQVPFERHDLDRSVSVRGG